MKQNTNISAATNAVTINNESKKATVFFRTSNR